ncbi:unnamed protein product [Oppiella nova]|uniref:Uncharacterized protein n=1 Tax=Oppiella nova TaxID=334625 RepID=A0A7R9LND1_9ACAR|nr:unnamed protein product [Oppiella nova]CAG2165346.1 unnamed protein product [Oppiella nova]
MVDSDCSSTIIKDKLLIVTLLTIFGGILADYKCPPNPDIFLPCECIVDPDILPLYRSIYCKGDQLINLTALFQRLSHELKVDEKDYLYFTLSNKAVDVLPANVFADITFQHVQLEGKNLTKVHRLALNGTQNTLKSLRTHSPLIDGDEDWDLFKAINLAPNLNFVEILFDNLTKIPDNALQSHPNLQRIDIAWSWSLTSIGRNAFKNLTKVESISIEGWVKDIGDEAFAVSHVSTDKRLWLSLLGNHLNNHNLRKEVFSGINRPVDLYIIENRLKFISESTYEAFLQQNPNHTIISDTDCMDSRNDWLRNKYPNQWEDLHC